MSASQDWFGPTAAASSVQRRSVRGAVVNAVSGLGSQLVGLATLMVLARLLTPADFGRVAMAAVVVGVAAVFQDLGMSGATLRLRDLTHEQASNLFWVNAVAGVVMAALVWLAAPFMVAYYADREVGAVLQALVVTLVLGGLGAQHQALLQRGMRFGVLAWISAATALAAAAVSLLLAWRGAGYWALVAGTVAGSLAGTALSWIACGWRPGLPRRRVGTGPAIRFGLHMLGFGVLGFLARNLHNLLIGRAWGAAAAGLYSRAYGIGTQMNHAVLQPLGLVAPPAMAGMEPGRYRRYYETACTITVMATMPILFACLVLPGELVRVLLGSQWDEAATPLRLLAPGFLPQALMFTTGWVYLSAGNSQAMMRWGLLGWSGMIAATVVGVPYGLGGVALASTLASYILVWPCLLLAFRDTPLTARGVIAAVRNPVLAGLLAAGVAAGVLAMVPAQSALDRLLAGCGAFAAVDLLLLWTVMGQGPLLRQVLSQLRSATGRA